jgi:putative FmdB family regulatory protein
MEPSLYFILSTSGLLPAFIPKGTGMPIYEYQAKEPNKGCPLCRNRFEHIQAINEPNLSKCPECGAKIRKLISWCRAAVMEASDEVTRVEGQILNYEKNGMWSHAAELADKQAEKTSDKALKTRALDNYEKAGYDLGTLARHDNED